MGFQIVSSHDLLGR